MFLSVATIFTAYRQRTIGAFGEVINCAKVLRESYFLLSSGVPVERETQGRAGLECTGVQLGILCEGLRLPDKIAGVGECKIAALDDGVR